MICRGKELQKTQTEHQTETAETTCCCPLPQPHTTCRRSQGVGRGVEKERKQGEHLSHRSQACNAKKKAHHGTRLSPHLSSTTHTHHRISRCEYLPALTLPNDHAISDNRDRLSTCFFSPTRVFTEHTSADEKNIAEHLKEGKVNKTLMRESGKNTETDRGVKLESGRWLCHRSSTERVRRE